jgi:hypothetical protein
VVSCSAENSHVPAEDLARGVWQLPSTHTGGAVSGAVGSGKPALPQHLAQRPDLQEVLTPLLRS